MIGEQEIGKYLEGNGRCLSVLLSEPILNANLECYWYANLLRRKIVMNSEVILTKRILSLLNSGPYPGMLVVRTWK
jgi:hypothetical protein